MAKRHTILVVMAAAVSIGLVGKNLVTTPVVLDWNNYTYYGPFSIVEDKLGDRIVQHVNSSATNRSGSSATIRIDPHTTLMNSLQEGSNTTYCARWEEATDPWWVHHPMWDIWKENETHTCFYYNPTYTYQNRIYYSQFYNRCDNDNTLTRHMYSSGWAADLENVVLPLMQSIDRGQPYAVFNPSGCWHYAANKQDCSQPTCPSMDMSCYFLKFGTCPPIEAQAVTEWDVVVTRQHRPLIDSAYFYVMRQQQWLRQAVYKEVQRHTVRIPEGDCAVLHVRRGDIILHQQYSRKYYPVSDYVALLPQNRRQRIFLLTDDANAISEAHEFFPDINWYYLDRPRHRGAEGGWENQIPSKDPKQEVVTILSTFQLVQQCDTFVHSESGFARDVYRYMFKAHPNTLQTFQVDEHEKEKRSGKHNNSATELAGLLDERRRHVTSGRVVV